MHAIQKAATCDQAALGNSIPLRYGPEAIENLAKSFGKPLLCANLLNREGDLLAGLLPYKILEVGNLKIGVIGMTDPIPAYASAYKLKPMNPQLIMPGVIEEVRSAGAKTVIVLSHLNSTNDIQLAETIDGIDLILSAHDHKQITPPLQVNGTIIAEAGQYGEVLGRIDLILDESTGKVIEYRGELIPVNDQIPMDDEFQVAVKIEQEKVNERMSVEIGELLQPLECNSDQQCAAGNLLADSLLEYVKNAKVAIVINGHWTNGLKKGKILKRDLYSANRSTGNPAFIMLKVKQIQQFLKAAIKPENYAKTTRSQRGIPFGWPHVAGMTVLVDSKNPDQLEIQVDGRTLNPEEDVMTAASDMEFSEILGYLPIDDDKIEYEVPTILPEIVEVYLEKHTPLEPDTGDRIQFI